MSETRSGEASRQFALLVVLCFVAGGLYGWSALIPALQAQFHISTEAAGLVFSVAIVTFSISVFAIPRLSSTFHSADATPAYGLIGAVCLIGAATAPSFRTFLVTFAVGFGAISGAIYVVCVSAAGRARRPYLATSVTIAAFGLGGATFGPAMRFLVGYGSGLSALYLLAAVMAVVSAIGIFIERDRSSRHPLDAAQVEAGPADGPPSSATVALLFCTFATGSFAGLMTLGLATSILDDRAAALWLSGLALFGVAFGNTCGRLSVGFLAEWFSPATIVVASPVIAATGALLALSTGTAGSAAIALTVIATGYGVMASGLPSLTRAFTGAAGFSRVFSFVFIAWGLAGFVAPWIAGRLFDTTGGFASAFVLSIAASSVAFGCGLALWRRLARS